jgi:hypothetical protein
MPMANVNGVQLFYELSGAGEILWSSCMGLGCRIIPGISSFRTWLSRFEFWPTTGAATAEVSAQTGRAASERMSPTSRR